MGSLPSGLSGSRAAAIVGLSRYRSPVEVWLDIMEERSPGFCAEHGFEREVFEGNASTRWGTAFEGAVIRLAEIEAGDVIVDCEREFAREHAGAPLTCHLDGVYARDQIIHEGKTTTAFSFRDAWGEPGSDRIPQEYQVQVQHQLLVSGLKRAIVTVLVFPERPDEWEAAGLVVDTETRMIARTLADGTVALVDSCFAWARCMRDMGYLHRYEIAADPVTQAALLDVYADFWAVHVLGETPPNATKYADACRLFTAPKGTIVADDEMERALSEYRLINDELAAMTKRKDQIKAAVVSRMAEIASARGAAIDDESTEKWVVRGASGKKLAQYGRSKRGGMEFR